MHLVGTHFRGTIFGSCFWLLFRNLKSLSLKAALPRKATLMFDHALRVIAGASQRGADEEGQKHMIAGGMRICGPGMGFPEVLRKADVGD